LTKGIIIRGGLIIAVAADVRGLRQKLGVSRDAPAQQLGVKEQKRGGKALDLKLKNRTFQN